MGVVTLNAWGKIATITYPDAMDDLAPAAFADAYDYATHIVDDDNNIIPNPQSEEEFAIEKIFDYVGEIMRAYSMKEHQVAALDAATAAADAAMGSITVAIVNE
jgi:formylmethanofuran:tetrahydromethanopterin formyltransferase